MPCQCFYIGRHILNGDFMKNNIKKIFKISLLITIFSALLIGLFSGNKAAAKRTNFLDGLLKWHNYYRKLHGVPALKWSKRIENYARQWAKNLAARNRMYHRRSGSYGENLFWYSGSRTSSKRVVSSWYNEIRYYNFNRPGFSSKTGHFTQVVWKNTRKLGCAYARARRGGIYVVCNYSPPGNVMGRFRRNVPRKK